MPRAASVTVENNFSKGLITEISGVNSPENSVTSSSNVTYDRKGKAKARQGFRYEDGATQVTYPHTGVRNEFLWETVSDNASKTFVVVQFGSNVKFFELVDGQSLSSGFTALTVNLLSNKISTFPDSAVSGTNCTFSAGKGYLFIAHPACNPVYIKYTVSTNSITVNPIAVQIRDFETLDDGLAVDARPATLTATHNYNLFNQGWYPTVFTPTTPTNAMVYWFNELGFYPSDVDFWWFYTLTDTEGDTVGADKFDPDATYLSRNGYLGNTPAARGHYILNPFQTTRSALSGVAGVPETSSLGYRPSVVSFFAGRAFYAGVGTTGYSSTIYFTQIIEDDTQLGKCYQANDPTAKDSFDLLPSDGGTIKIQDINTVLDMRVIGQALYVFASNGVWSITGSDNASFRATDYTVSKISSFPALSRSSIVDIGGLPVWWNYEGIFALKKSEVGLTSEVTNLTESTIQSFYDVIPQSAKLTAKGAFNDQTGLVYWIYNIMPEEGPFKYTNILAFDAYSGTFYPMTIPESSIEVSGLVAVRNEGLKVFKFLTVNLNIVTFSEIIDDTYFDWGTIPYETFFITGYRIRGDIIKDFQTNYLSVVSEEIDSGSCYVQGLWDYTYDEQSARFSNPQQVYRYGTYRNYQRSRLKMRGTGYSLQFKFFGEAGKPFTIVGWSGFETTNGLP
jgi:hypothetical protein